MVYLALGPPPKCSKTKKSAPKTLNDDFALDFLIKHGVLIFNVICRRCRLGFEPIFDFQRGFVEFPMLFRTFSVKIKISDFSGGLPNLTSMVKK